MNSEKAKDLFVKVADEIDSDGIEITIKGGDAPSVKFKAKNNSIESKNKVRTVVFDFIKACGMTKDFFDYGYIDSTTYTIIYSGMPIYYQINLKDLNREGWIDACPDLIHEMIESTIETIETGISVMVAASALPEFKEMEDIEKANAVFHAALEYAAKGGYEKRPERILRKYWDM